MVQLTKPKAASKGTLYTDFDLAPLTSWRIGGRAARLYRPVSIGDLSEFLRTIPADEPLFFLGLGSNILIRDSGFAGTVVHLQKGLNAIEIDSANSSLIRAEAGVPCAKIAKFAGKHSLVGAEFFAGIPGTIGGALAMNAGAFGGETWQNIVQVAMLDRYGNLKYKRPEDFKIAYRQVTPRDSSAEHDLFVAAWLKFPTGDPHKALQGIKELLQKRSNTQPIGTFNCGSVFKNPQGYHAAQLIESLGLKGLRVGDAVVSEKHANFIINQGAATAADVEQLIELVQARVFAEYGIELELEVRIVP